MYDPDQVARGMKRLMLRLPAVRQTLPERVRRDEEVQVLCGAFEDAATALHELRKNSGNQQIIQEYEEICADIEQDIQRICGRNG